MAKTYEELLEQAAIIRDETAAGKNTATRVGGTITDAVDYVKELQDTYAGIHAEAAAAKTEAAAAKSTASEAKMNATAAMNTARSASLNATAASGTANEAKAESAQAVSTAQEAKEAADSAKQTANAAKATADAAKKESAQAVRTAQSAQTKNEEQDNRIANAEAINTKQNERLLNYVYPKIYQLNEGAGSLPFDGMYSGSASVLDGRKTVAEEGFTYKVVFASGKFLLLEINQDGEDAGLYQEWDKIISGRGSSEDYTRRDCLYYIYVSGEGSTYYYIDSKGVASEQSATYLLRRLVDKNTDAIAKLQGNVVGPGGDTSEGVSQIKELGEFDTFAALLAQAANFYIVSNNAIALLHGTYKQAESIYNGVLILQQVEKNNEGGGTAMQYIYNQNRQFTRSITFSATAVTAVQSVQNHGARNLSLSGRVLQMTNMWGENVGDSATLPDNGNIYEGEAGASSVPVVLAKTFGGTVTATLGAATSARAGVMSVDHVNKIKKLEERVLQYLYPKLYQLNEGAGALPFDGIYDGNASVSTDRKEAVEEGFTYKVVFKLGSFYLQEISPGGTTVCLYSAWGKIISGRGSSEDYKRKDCLYYVYTEGEGSYYYYVDADGNISEQAGTYLLRRLIDETKAKITGVESTANAAKSAAETAQTAAETAQETANRAQETATAASNDAQKAKTAAETAQSTATAAQTKNSEQDTRLDNIEARIEPDIAGRVWNEDNGTYRAESYYGSVKALRDLPKRLGLGRYIVDNYRNKRKLHPNDSHKYLDDGSTANLDGRDGQCMWCWEGFYANIWHEGSRLIKAVTFDGPVGNDISIWIPAGGISWLGAGVIDRGDAPYTDKTKWKLCSVISEDERYRGGGGTALDASKYTKAPADTTPQITMLGMPATNISTTDFGTYARRRGDGEGWEANWFVARFVVEFLFEVIMGTENSQEAFNNLKDADGLYQGGFGTGITDILNWASYNGGFPLIPTSVGLAAGDGVCLVDYNLPNASGGTFHRFKVPVFFGLVGAGFGNLWQFVRGIIMDAGENKSLVYVSPSMYADYNPKIISDKIMVAECPRESGWIMRKSYKGLCCMPTELGGTQDTYYSDTFYTKVNSLTDNHFRVRAAGGNATDNNSMGASCTLTFSDATKAFNSYSAPLCYFTEDPIIPESQSIATNY